MLDKIRIYDDRERVDYEYPYFGAEVDGCWFRCSGETEAIAKKKLILEIRHARTAFSDWLDTNTAEGI